MKYDWWRVCGLLIVSFGSAKGTPLVKAALGLFVAILQLAM